MKRASLCLLLVAAAPPLRSGHEDASPAAQAMQDDDTANPGMLWVQQGEALWNQAAGTSGWSGNPWARSIAGCATA